MYIRFRIAARCEAAGRPNNEDNYQICDDLQAQHWGFTANAELQLSDKGSLLVVCDGMGGMNAGEVASAIAVETIKQCFALERLTPSVLSSASSIRSFIVEAIQAADLAIKTDGTNNPEHQGMGSTIVLAWLLGDRVYIGWCGDSRIYRYNPINGFERLSHDHSYVQELVDAGKLTEELAFDHPNNNIITRSLGDPNGTARPDTADFPLFNDDIILLCSDGLCGTLRDNEIQRIIADNRASMIQCRDVLWQEDEAAGWHDNVTIVLAQIISGATEAVPPQPTPIPEPKQGHNNFSDSKAELKRKNKMLIITLCCLIGLLIVGGGVFAWLKFGRPNVESTPKQESNVKNDSLKTDSINKANETAAIVAEQFEENAKAGESEKKQHQTSSSLQTIPQSITQSTQNAGDNGEIEQLLQGDDSGNSGDAQAILNRISPDNKQGNYNVGTNAASTTPATPSVPAQPADLNAQTPNVQSAQPANSEAEPAEKKTDEVKQEQQTPPATKPKNKDFLK